MVIALADALHTLLRLPGATYACVVERDSGRVLAELGQGEASTGDSEGVVAYSVSRWGTAVAAMFGATSGDELDDVMITGRRSYQLVRPLGAGAEVLVYLRLDRSRSNLAAARRELAAVRLAGGAATPDQTAAPPAPGSARTRDDTSAPAARRPVAATSPAPPARVPASLAPPTTPARGLRGTPSEPARSDPARSEPAAVEPAAAEPADTATPVSASGRRAPRAHGASSGARSSGSGQGRASGRTQNRTQSRTDASPSVPSVPSAVPTRTRPAGEATRQIPLPRRAPGRPAADAGPSRRPETRRGAAPTAARARTRGVRHADRPGPALGPGPGHAPSPSRGSPQDDLTKLYTPWSSDSAE